MLFTNFTRPLRLFPLFLLAISFTLFQLSFAYLSNGNQVFDINSFYGVDMVAQSLRWETSRQANSKILACPSIYFGGYDVFYNYGDYMQRTWTHFPPHNSITFHFLIKLIDQWDAGDSIDIYLDGNSFPYVTPINGLNTFGETFCGDPNSKEIQIIYYGGMPHTSSQLTLTLVNKRGTSPTGSGTFAIRDVQILLNQNPYGSIFYSIYSLYPISAIPGNFLPPCSWQFYYHDNVLGCQPCHANCLYCYGNAPSQCYRCIDGYNYDGYNCMPCDSSSNCAICMNSNPNSCSYCKPPYYLIDNSCVSCAAPFIQSSDGFGQCLYPCLSNEYLYSDGTCCSTCDPRLTATQIHGRSLCIFPCVAGEIRYFDGTCQTAECPYPLEMRLYGSYYICDYPCQGGLVLYNDSSCGLLSDCVYPFVLNSFLPYTNFQVCGYKCSLLEYRYNNDSCFGDCPEPLVARKFHGALLCDPPRCGPIQCSSCTPFHACPEYYECHVFTGNWCMFKYDYTLEIQYPRFLVNGLMISVSVTPLTGIGIFNDDILEFKIPTMQLDKDYTCEIKKSSTGNFDIKLLFTKSFDQVNTKPVVLYSPGVLYVEQTLTLPHIIFISDEVKMAANTVDATSQITFILFLVGIFGMIFGGGIASLWTSVPDFQYMYYLLYLNVDYLHHKTLYFQSLANYDMLVGSNTGPTLNTRLKTSLPDRFFILDYSPDFLENSDKIFLQLILMLSGFILGSLSLKFLRYPKGISFIQKFFGYFIKIVKWNGLIRQLMTYILPLSTASFVQIYFAVFGLNKPRLFSAILAPVTFLIIVCFLVKIWNLIRNVPGGRYEKAVYTKLFGTLWESLYSTSIGKYYFWLGSLRNVLLAYVTVFFDIFPQVQIATLVTYQLGMIGLFFEYSPDNLFPVKMRRLFEDSTLNTLTFVEEILMLSMKILIWISILKKDSAEDSTMILIGWLIIIPGVLTQVLQTGFSLLSQVRNRRKLWGSFRVTLHKLLLPMKKRRKKIFRPFARSLRIKSRRNLTTETVEFETAQNDTIMVTDLIALKSLETENYKIERKHDVHNLY